MPKFIIERNIPAIGSVSQEELKNACRHSNATIREMSHSVQWLHSYVTSNKLYCVYIAPDREAVLEHAKKGGFPANSIEEVGTMIDPVSGE